MDVGHARSECRELPQCGCPLLSCFGARAQKDTRQCGYLDEQRASRVTTSVALQRILDCRSLWNATLVDSTCVRSTRRSEKSRFSRNSQRESLCPTRTRGTLLAFRSSPQRGDDNTICVSTNPTNDATHHHWNKGRTIIVATAADDIATIDESRGARAQFWNTRWQSGCWPTLRRVNTRRVQPTEHTSSRTCVCN